jgi:valyl-tRNA synthetase
MEFGTGAVKITPAHDTNDYEVGIRHQLDFINILNDDGTFNENTGDKFKVCLIDRIYGNIRAQNGQGMKRFHARVAVVQALKDANLYIEAKDNPMQVPTCRYAVYVPFLDLYPIMSSKSGDIIEPVLKPQWWVNCKPLAEEAIKVCLLFFHYWTLCQLDFITAHSCWRIIYHSEAIRK